MDYALETKAGGGLRKINSIGNFYRSGVSLAANNGLFLSSGDVYASGVSVFDTGSDNSIIEYSPYYVGGPTSTYAYRHKQSYVLVGAERYSGTRSGVTTPAGTVVPDFVGEKYIDTTNHKVYISEGLLPASWLLLN